MKTRLVRIGNSRGIRVPKLLLEQAGLPEEVEITAEGESIGQRQHGFWKCFKNSSPLDENLATGETKLPAPDWAICCRWPDRMVVSLVAIADDASVRT